jgi:hypothetical protein
LEKGKLVLFSHQAEAEGRSNTYACVISTQIVLDKDEDIIFYSFQFPGKGKLSYLQIYITLPLVNGQVEGVGNLWLVYAEI